MNVCLLSVWPAQSVVTAMHPMFKVVGSDQRSSMYLVGDNLKKFYVSRESNSRLALSCVTT